MKKQFYAPTPVPATLSRHPGFCRLQNDQPAASHFAVCSTTVSAQSLQKPDQGLDSKVKQTLKKNAETLWFMENKGQIADKNILYYFEGKMALPISSVTKFILLPTTTKKEPCEES